MYVLFIGCSPVVFYQHIVHICGINFYSASEGEQTRQCLRTTVLTYDHWHRCRPISKAIATLIYKKQRQTSLTEEVFLLLKCACICQKIKKQFKYFKLNKSLMKYSAYCCQQWKSYCFSTHTNLIQWLEWKIVHTVCNVYLLRIICCIFFYFLLMSVEQIITACSCYGSRSTNVKLDYLPFWLYLSGCLQ